MNDDAKTKEQLILELVELRQLRDALDRIDAFVYVKDRQGLYVYGNRPTLERFKCPAEEFHGANDARFFPPDTVARMHAVDKRVLERGENTAREIESNPPDGSRRVYWDVKAPIYDATDKGRIRGLLGISTDITDRIRMEEALRGVQEDLQKQVVRQTSELIQVNADLRGEIVEHMYAENELRKSNERLRVAQEMSLDAFTILSPVRNKDGDIVDFRWDFVNPEAGRILRYPPEDLVGRRLLDVLPGNRTESDLFDRYVRVFETGEPHDYEVCYESEGVLGWFRNMAVKLGDSIAVNFSDITKRKQAEAALRESEERFKGLAESMTQMVWITDGEGNSLYHNPRFEEYTGLKESGAEERMQLIHPEDRERVQETWTKYLHAGGEFQSSYRMRGRDGEYRWFHGRSSVLRDADRRPTRWFVTATDIDDRVRAENALAENLGLLAEAERIGITGSWKRDLSTNQIVCSSGFYRIYGIPENEEVTFETFQSLIHPEDRDYLLGKLEEMVRKRTPAMAEYRIVRPDGTTRFLFTRGEAAFDSDGKPILIHATAQDITERKRLEDELINARKLEAIGTLAAGIAHDYNNLLTAVLGNLELGMMSLEKKEASYSPLAKAQEAALSAATLTRKFITFARGGYPVKQPLNVLRILTQSVTLALSGSNTKAEWRIADDLASIDADEDQIRQVIHNVATNAREAMPHGGILFVEAGNTVLETGNSLSLAAGPYVRLSFRDEGTGIPAENFRGYSIPTSPPRKRGP